MKSLFFDECGFTGNNLLDETQPYFSYLGIHSNKNIELEFIKLKKKYGYDLTETKGFKLCKSSKGRNLVNELWSMVINNVKYVIHNKKYALAAKMFEYVYEPIYPDCNMIFYTIDFHRYFSSLIYSLFTSKDLTAESLYNSFKRYIKNKKQDDFLALIENVPKLDHPLYYFYKFCELHRNEIACDIDFSTPMNDWLLDLTMTSLYTLLGQFAGDSSEELLVVCDESKPLRDDKIIINKFIGDTRILYSELLGKKTRINYNLKDQIQLNESKNCISLQIADILVSSISYAINHNNEYFSKKILECTRRCFSYNHSVLPIDLFKQYDQIEFDIFIKIMHELCKKKSKEEKIENIKKLGFNICIYRQLYKL